MSEMNSKRKRLVFDVGLLYIAAIWGSTFFVVKDALSGVDPVVLVAWRFLIAGGLLAAFLVYKKLSLFKNLKQGVVLGLLMFMIYVPQTIGLGITTASNSGFITGMFVLFVPIFMVTIFKKRPSKMELFAVVLALAGLWILTGGLSDINSGDLMTLVTAMFVALHLMYADRFMKSGADVIGICSQQFLVTSLLSFIAAFVFGLPLGIETASAGWSILFLAVFPTLTAFVIQMAAQKISAPMRISMFFALEPIFAAGFAWTLGGEQFRTQSALGGLFIFAALIVSGIKLRSEKG
jgi:drug/metabolite transporter (DMT)-like permease